MTNDFFLYIFTSPFIIGAVVFFALLAWCIVFVKAGVMEDQKTCHCPECKKE